MKKSLAILLATLLLPVVCWAWGREGHQIIATVAEDHLAGTTKVMIQSLIGNNHLYSIAPWADEARKERRETGPWHYVNIPLGSTYKASRDCPLPHSCVVTKIDDFVKVLTDKQASREERAEALKFLVHFVGDIHQPMHTVKEEAGGNGIHVRFLDSDRCGRYECSLHGVWDTSMILYTGMKRADHAAHVEELIKVGRLGEVPQETPTQWANDSLKLAEAAWVQDGTDLDEKYYDQQIRVVDRQMALAGLRLARLFNATIGKMTPRDFADNPKTTAETESDLALTGGTTAQSAADVKVWVNKQSGVYHCSVTAYYGKTKHGEYMSEAGAAKAGYRPAGGRVCGREVRLTLARSGFTVTDDEPLAYSPTAISTAIFCPTTPP